jgi:Protein of unknown function (DUF3592)
MPDDSGSALATIFFLLFLMFAGIAIFWAIQGLLDEHRENRLAPVRVSLWQNARRLLNPGRQLRRSQWTATQAIVKQSYSHTRRARRSIYRYRPLLQISDPFRATKSYSYVIWYQYEVSGTAYWGKFLYPVGYDNPREATEIARGMIGRNITVQYDPQYPEDSLPAIETLAGPPVLHP